MAPPQQCRVLRCCSCRLFQAHQVTKSSKWTCKACGEKQSFLRAYGEGSGADCRRHVQKLNLLQGQLSERSPRILEGGVQDEEEGNPRLDEHARLQPRASESRWQKYLEGDSKEKTLTGDIHQEAEATSCREFSLKRKRSPSTVSPPSKLFCTGLGPLSSLREATCPKDPTQRHLCS